MDEQQIKNILIKYLNEYVTKNRLEINFYIENVHADFDLGVAMGIDSLDGLDILLDLEQRFNIKIDDTDSRLIARNFTMYNLITTITKLKNKK